MLDTLPGIQIKTGRFREDTEIHLSAAKTTFSEIVRVTEVTAENTAEKRTIALEPIKFTITGTDLGGSVGNLPDLRDITVDVKTRDRREQDAWLRHGGHQAQNPFRPGRQCSYRPE